MLRIHETLTLRKIVFTASTTVFVFLLALMVSAAFAQDIPWTGNGTNNGFCNDNTQDPNVPLGMQSWLFILTSPDDSGSYVLSYNFLDGTQGTIVGVRKGNGSVHFQVLTAADAQLLSASATGGTANSVLTVSHCESNNVTAALEVSKDAITTFTRTYTWDIQKSANPSVLDLFVNDTGATIYTVAVVRTGYYDSDWAVSGTITIYNPSPVDATGVSVSDDISGVGGVSVNCPSDVVPAGATMQCTYSSSLPDGAERTNTATVTTAGPVAGGSGQAAVTFGAPTNEVLTSVTVSDSMIGSLGSFGDGDSVTYERGFSCYNDEGTHENTATIDQTGQSSSASVQVNCYELGVSKTAEASVTTTHLWDIEKSVDPSVLDLFVGDSGDVIYTVTVTHTGVVETGWVVSGTITISNPAPMNAELVSVTDIVSPVIWADVNCPSLTVPAFGVLVCTYSAPLPDSSDRVNTATATLQNTPGGTTDFIGTADVHFGDPSEIDASVDVIDSLVGYLGTLTDSYTFTYPYTFTCGVTGDYENTADVIGSNGVIDSASAFVHLNCYELIVTKTAETTFDRAWNWTIDKSADQSSLSLETGQSTVVNYTVTVDAAPVDSGWTVSGTITISNPAPMDASLVGVTDILGPVECASLNIPAFGAIECSYLIGLPDGSSLVNTATATLQNTPSGTTDFSGSADVSFGGAPNTETDECIDVSDTFAVGLGTVCAGDGVPYSFTYVRDVGPYENCGQQDPLVNTASFVANDSGAAGEDTVTIPVTVECAQGQGCTPGYWKNHTSNWGPTGYAPGNPVSVMFSATPAPYATKTLVKALALKGGSTPDGGREILLRAAVAAMLNAADPRVNYPLSAATIQAQVNAVIATNDRAAMIALAGVLDDYNNGGCPLN